MVTRFRQAEISLTKKIGKAKVAVFGVDGVSAAKHNSYPFPQALYLNEV